MKRTKLLQADGDHWSVEHMGPCRTVRGAVQYDSTLVGYCQNGKAHRRPLCLDCTFTILSSLIVDNSHFPALSSTVCTSTSSNHLLPRVLQRHVLHSLVPNHAPHYHRSREESVCCKQHPPRRAFWWRSGGGGMATGGVAVVEEVSGRSSNGWRSGGGGGEWAE